MTCLCLFVACSLIAPAGRAEGLDSLPKGYDPQWNLKIIGADRAWALTRGSSSIVVGVIDTGIDPSHQEFAGRLVPGKNFAGGADTSDSQGHGTFVAGIIAGASVGVAPNVKLMPLKVFDNNGYSSNRYIAEAIRYAVNNGVKILNLSLGGLRETDELSDAIAYAYKKGTLIICAAGNSGQDAAGSPVPYPAASKGSFAVAATTWDDKHAFYSSVGPWVKVSAPGGDYNGSYAKDPMHSIYGAHPGNKLGQYEQFVGTSFAAPHVAGLAALIWSVNPELSNYQVEQLISRTADRVWTQNVERDDRFGYGRVNAYRAVLAAMPHDYRLQLMSPTNGSTASTSITFAGWAADLRSQAGPLVESVQFFVDGPLGQGTPIGEAQFPVNVAQLPRAAEGADQPPMDTCGFSFTWDVSGVDPGVRQVYVGAKMLSGDWVWGQVSVKVEK